MKEMYYWQAINEALAEEMTKDPSVFIMGEDVGIYGGAYAVTRGLYDSDQAPDHRDRFGAGIKFTVPTIADGRVFVGAQTGVTVFGLLK